MGKMLGLLITTLFVALGAANDAANADPTEPAKRHLSYAYRHRHHAASPQAPAAVPVYYSPVYGPVWVPVYVPAYLDPCHDYAYGAVTWACAGQSPDNTGDYSDYR